MNITPWVLIGLAQVLIFWFLGGFLVNRRRNAHVRDWLIAHFRKLGELYSVSRLSQMTTGGRMAFSPAREPFDQFDVIYILELRENLPIWLVKRLQGRRDEVMFRAILTSTPISEFEVGNVQDLTYRSLIIKEHAFPFTSHFGPHNLEISRRGSQKPEPAAHLDAFLEKHGKTVFRVSIRRSAPHLVVRARLAPLERDPSDAFIDDLAALARGIIPAGPEDQETPEHGEPAPGSPEPNA